MPKFIYLKQNRYGIFVIRLSLPVKKVEKSAHYEILLRSNSPSTSISYRQVVCSLHTRSLETAKTRYFEVMSNALPIVHISLYFYKVETCRGDFFKNDIHQRTCLYLGLCLLCKLLNTGKLKL